jgi:N-acetylneuraminate synthase
MGSAASVTAVALGACVIEKHFTIDRKDGGVDSAFSMEPNELKQLVIESERAWQSLGKITYGPTKAEEKSLQFRRSLYIVEDIRAGDRLTKENVRAIRPGFGLPPKYIDTILGMSVTKDLKKGTALSWEILRE